MKKYIILDRDGVINYDSDEYIKSPEEWLPIPGSLEAIAQLNRSGFHVLIATNQSGLARNLFTLDDLNNIHEKLIHKLSAVGGYIDEIFFCPHHPQDNCECRKPKPGLLFNIQKKYGLNLQETYFIGDSFRDIQAAIAAGCIPIFVLTGKGESVLQNHPEMMGIKCFENLRKAVEYIVLQKEEIIHEK